MAERERKKTPYERKKTPYKRMVDRTAEGEYELVEPIDTMILKLLPQQGELFAGLYPLGETAKNLVTKLGGKDKAPSTIVSIRLRILSLQGLTAKTKSVTRSGGSTVWQRTEAATKLLKSRGLLDG